MAVAQAQDRLPTIPPQDYTPEQKQAAEAFAQARGKPPFGPFEPLMHSPEVMTLARSMGDYLRFKPKIGTTLSELVILLTARRWTQDYEWYVHAPIAEKAGIAPEIIAAIRDGRRPARMSDDETIVYDFTSELQDNEARLGRDLRPGRDPGSGKAGDRRSRGHLGLLHVPGHGAERRALPDSRRTGNPCRECRSRAAYPQGLEQRNPRCPQSLRAVAQPAIGALTKR